MKYLLSLLVLVFIFACEEESSECPDTASCIEQDTLTFDDLPVLRQTILALAKDSNCEENSECRFIGFGSKACGGVSEWLIYTSSPKDAELLALVDSYNKLEKEYNEYTGYPSDCSIESVPDSVVCSGNGCVAYRGETTFTEGVCCK